MVQQKGCQTRSYSLFSLSLLLWGQLQGDHYLLQPNNPTLPSPTSCLN